jgi:formate dehydrogenase iron-sulfur subunit
LSKAVLYDATLCIDCKQCEQACAKEHHLPYNDAIGAEEERSAHKLTVVLDHKGKFMRRLCMSCLDPTCVSVCPVAALRKLPEGPVSYDSSRCIGCRYCMLACPFDTPKYEWNALLPLMHKCDMCSERVEAGKPTACAEACPTGATKFGERDELIVEAQKRLRDSPQQYIHHIFGLQEAGGTSVLLLSSVPFEEFRYRYHQDLAKQPLPLLTYRVLTHVPDVVTLGGVFLGGICWITHRREEVAAAEGKKDSDKKKG